MVWLQADGNHEQALDLEEAALLHYIRHGFAEGRPTDEFDPLAYLASNPDLIAAFGALEDPEEAATLHYIRHGFFEGRPDDPLDGEGPEEPEEPEGPDEPEDGEPEGAMETAGAADFLL